VRKLWAAFLVLSAASSMVEAAETRMSLRVGVGVAALTGEAGDFYKPGPVGALALGYDLNGSFTLLAGVDYARLGVDEDALFADFVATVPAEFASLPRSTIVVEGGDTTFLTGSLHLKASILGHASPISPYVIGGGGVTRVSADEATVGVSIPGFEDAETVLGYATTAPSIAFGGGLDLKVGPLSVFGEGRYYIAFTEDESTKHMTLRVGLSLGL